MNWFSAQPESTKREFERAKFLYFTPGQHVIRVLGDGSYETFTHYVKASRAMVKCLEDECPICKQNMKILSEHPDDYNKQAGWIGRSWRHYFNVMDKTNVKICQECGEEVKADVSGQYPATCSQGHMVINDVPSPSNKVKVVNLSKTNGELLKSYHNTVLDEEGNPLGITNFDLLFTVIESKGSKSITPSPLGTQTGTVEFSEEDLFDLENALITLDVDEIIELLKGVSLRDIFLARNAKPDVVIEDKAVETNKDIQTKIDELFA